MRAKRKLVNRKEMKKNITVEKRDRIKMKEMKDKIQKENEMKK